VTATTTVHLTDDQIIHLLLDPSDLPENLKVHLAECAQCRKALDGLWDDLRTVGNLARAATPAARGKFHLPARQIRRPLALFTGMRLFTRLAVSVIALVLLMGAFLLINPGPDIHNTSETSQAVDPDQLLSEIDELVESPVALDFLITTPTNELDADEDFMEFIVPVIDNDPITRSTGRKGELLC